MIANNYYYDAAMAYSPSIFLFNFFYINLHISYVLNVYFAEPTWTRFWFSFLMGFLKFFKKPIYFKCDGMVSHILGPKYLRLSKPWFTFFAFLKLYWSACLKRKRLFKISGEISRCTLYTFWLQDSKVFMMYRDKFNFI